MAQPKSFTIDIPQTKLDEIKHKVDAFPFRTFRAPAAEDWKYGPPPSYMAKLAKYWSTEYNWSARQARMNELPQFIAKVDGLDIHFVHLRRSNSSNGRPPILLLHGWPYSFNSFHDIALQLAYPERFGGQAEEGVDVVVPSMPGYDFSPAASGVTGPRRIAELYDTLMIETLGYKRFISHGGDWGSYISELLGFHYPEHVAGIHLTMSSVRQYGAECRTGQLPPGATEEELDFAKHEYDAIQGEAAYSKLQGTKPVKLGYAMADSPVGVAAWIVEAFHAWADLKHNPKSFEEIFSFDDLLDEIMLYLVTDAFHTSTWIYIGENEEGPNVLPEGRRIEVPCGILALPDPVFPMMPRVLAERSRRVVRYNKAKLGGHFPFYECRDELMKDLKGFLLGIE